MADMLIASPFNTMNLAADTAASLCSAVYVYKSYGMETKTLPITNVKYAIATNIWNTYGPYFGLSNIYIPISSGNISIPYFNTGNSTISATDFVYELTASTFKAYVYDYSNSYRTSYVTLLLFT